MFRKLRLWACRAAELDMLTFARIMLDANLNAGGHFLSPEISDKVGFQGSSIVSEPTSGTEPCQWLSFILSASGWIELSSRVFVGGGRSVSGITPPTPRKLPVHMIFTWYSHDIHTLGTWCIWSMPQHFPCGRSRAALHMEALCSGIHALSCGHFKAAIISSRY